MSTAFHSEFFWLLLDPHASSLPYTQCAPGKISIYKPLTYTYRVVLCLKYLNSLSLQSQHVLQEYEAGVEVK
jgi:hypothetical protein